MKSRNPRRNRKVKVVRKPREETAKMKETISLEDLKTNTAYDASVKLQDFTRALDIADNFQEYRITKVVYKYTPLFDTFIDTAGSNSLPYLYSSRQILPPPASFGIAYLKALGAKPRRLDDKTLTVSYTPNVNAVMTSDLSGGVIQSTSPRYKPWISTHIYTTTTSMDNTNHYGHQFWIDQLQAAAGNQCSLEVTAHFEFRKPWDLKTITAGDSPVVKTSKKV